MTFDNHDSRIRYVDLFFERDDLDNIPEYALPEGYRFAFYQPGDRDAWIAVEKSAKEFTTFEEGVRAWENYYANVEDDLGNRMLFIENGRGEKVATATAYYNPGGDLPCELGQVHWVAVRREDQGRGLARPLIAQALRVMKQRGHTRAMLHTQTTTWLACKLYMDFGFHPMRGKIDDYAQGWRILRALTDHPALSAFEKAEMEEILAEKQA